MTATGRHGRRRIGLPRLGLSHDARSCERTLPGAAARVWHDAPVPSSRLPLLLLGLVLAALALGGCARVQAALAVQPDDTVTGQVVVATPQTGPDDRGPAITLPPDLQPDVDMSSYQQDGYVGSVVRFDGLTFDQTARLTQAVGP